MGVGSPERAEALLELGRAREALSVVASVLANQPGDTGALLVAARCHLQLEEPQRALSAATTALSRDPAQPLAWTLASLAHTQAGRRDAAVWHAEQAVARWPQLPAGYYALVLALLNQRGSNERARATAAHVLQMEPLEPSAHVLAAQAEMYPGRFRPGPAARYRARAHLVAALELDPSDLEARQELANLAALGWGFTRGLRGSAQSLQLAPLEEAPLGAIAYIFRRLIWLVHLIIVVAYVGCLIGSASENPVVMRIAASTAAVVLVLLLWNIRRQLGRATGAHLRAFPRRDWSGTAWLGSIVLAVVCLNLGSWVPALEPVLALASPLIGLGALMSWIPREFRT